jgi:hypothetical protein
MKQAMGHYLRGCANVSMAHTPQQALTALHETQTSLLSHSADTFAEITRLWRKQNNELLTIRAEHAPRRRHPAARSRTTKF